MIKTDSQLQSNILDELKWEPSVHHEHIGLSVEKHSAEKATQQVSGFKAIVENIEVKLPGSFVRNDEDIAKAILEQFEWSTLIPQERIKVSVSKAWVTLSGEASWEYQRKEIAAGLKASIEDLKQSGINNEEVLTILLITQHYDALEAMSKNANTNTILVPYSSGNVTGMREQIQEAILTSVAASKN